MRSILTLRFNEHIVKAHETFAAYELQNCELT